MLILEPDFRIDIGPFSEWAHCPAGDPAITSLTLDALTSSFEIRQGRTGSTTLRWLPTNGVPHKSTWRPQRATDGPARFQPAFSADGA